MHQWTGSALVQIMACRLSGAKPLPEPMQAYCQLDPWEQISVKFESKSYTFHSRKCIWICCLPKWQPFCPGWDELKCKMCETHTFGCSEPPVYTKGMYVITVLILILLLLDVMLTHLPLDKMAAILLTIFSDAFSWMKSFEFWLKVHWSLFLRVQLTITRHWFR